MKLRIEENEFPDGGKFYSVYHGKTRIGNYQRSGDGFLPQDCRKVLANERDAQFKVVQRYIAHHIGLAAKASELYEEI